MLLDRLLDIDLRTESSLGLRSGRGYRLMLLLREGSLLLLLRLRLLRIVLLDLWLRL
jgi:hypothetical protein